MEISRFTLEDLNLHQPAVEALLTANLVNQRADSDGYANDRKGIGRTGIKI